MCSGCGPVYAPVCACEAHPSRARQVSVCSSVCPSLPVSLRKCLYNLFVFVSLPLSFGVYIRLSLGLWMSLSDPPQSCVSPPPSQVRLGDVRPRPGGAQLPSARWGLRQRRPSRAGTGGLLLRLRSRRTGSPTPHPGSGTGWVEAKREVIVINECHN